MDVAIRCIRGRPCLDDHIGACYRGLESTMQSGSSWPCGRECIRLEDGMIPGLFHRLSLSQLYPTVDSHILRRRPLVPV
jgi:hypothetical protein